MASSGTDFLNKAYIFFLAIASTAFVVTLYHCLIVMLRNRRQHANQQQQRTTAQNYTDNRSSFDNSIAELLPTHKYEKGKGLNEGECSVCLSEFEEGDVVRTLPECLHSFHVDCIDMWLYSHRNCPMCRTNATPSPSPLFIGSSDQGADVGTRRLDLENGVSRDHLMVQRMTAWYMIVNGWFYRWVILWN